MVTHSFNRPSPKIFIFFIIVVIIPPSTEYRRIDGRLHTVGDTVLIPDLGYNGTILSFSRLYVRVLPHDYGPPVRRLTRNLRRGSGITIVQLSHLLEIGIKVNDHHQIHGGTFAARGRPNHNKTIDDNSLAEYFIFHNFRLNGMKY